MQLRHTKERMRTLLRKRKRGHTKAAKQASVDTTIRDASTAIEPPWWRLSVPHSLACIPDYQRNLSYNWLIDRGYVIGGAFDSTTNATLRCESGWDGTSLVMTLLCGNQRNQRGVWFPHAEWETFFRYYAFDLQYARSVPLFYNQCFASGVFRFALDLDFEGPTLQSDDEMRRVIQACHRVLGCCVVNTERPLDVFVCRTRCVRTDAVGKAFRAVHARKFCSLGSLLDLLDGDSPEHPQTCMSYVFDHADARSRTLRYKTGVHAYWNVFVDSARALRFAHLMHAALLLEFGPRPDGYNPWSDVVDTRPLRNGCLRLLGSDKTATCIICKSWHAVNPRCPGCHGVGKIVDARPYVPWITCAGNGKTVEPVVSTTLTLATLLRCSLHRTADSAACGAELSPLAHVKTTERAHVVPTPTHRAAVTPATSCAGRVRLDAADERVCAMQTCLSLLHRRYSDARITRMTVHANGSYYIITVDAQFCQNVGREHNSSNVYFLATRKGVHQRCYCRCTNKTCREYKSRAVQLPTAICATLFPSRTSSGQISAKIKRL
jgi:hypothetical protein